MAGVGQYEKENSLLALRNVGLLWFKERTAEKVVADGVARIHQLEASNDNLHARYHAGVRANRKNPLRFKVKKSDKKLRKARRNQARSEVKLANIRNDISAEAETVSLLGRVQIITEDDLQLLLKIRTKFGFGGTVRLAPISRSLDVIATELENLGIDFHIY